MADQLIADELAAKPGYYAGITDPAIEASRGAVQDAEETERQRLLANPGKLFVYTDPTKPQAADDEF